MDPTDPFTASLFKWDVPRGAAQVAPAGASRLLEPLAASPAAAAALAAAAYSSVRPRELGGLEELFQAYGIRYYTAARIAELGFTVSTLLDMKDEELDEMMNSLSHIFRWELLVGERYGIKAAVRAERRRHHMISTDTTTNNAFDALSQEGLSEDEAVQQQDNEAVGSGGGGGGGTWDHVVAAADQRKKQRRRRRGQKKSTSAVGQMPLDAEHDYDQEHDDNDNDNNGGIIMSSSERQREHPFIVTEPGEVARGKKNGLDYLFHLYEQCREFLIQVQNIAKERGEKCPSKVTNQVFRFAKKAGASYINKPKMRHYVHCYALHCLDEEASNALRRTYKERGENVGAWRQACYRPLVAIAAARQGWDIDAIFNSHPRLSIWYVPTKLRQLCHAERNAAANSSSVSVSGGRDDQYM